MKPSSNDHKIAERLKILIDFEKDLLVRLYNLYSDPSPISEIFSNKTSEAYIKLLSKKFPHIDFNSSSINSIVLPKKELIYKSCAPHYYTFLDVMILKQQVIDLLSAIKFNRIELNISRCFVLTVHYLEMVVNFIDIMLIVSKLTKIFPVLSLFVISYSLVNNQPESKFELMGKWLIKNSIGYSDLVNDLEIYYPRMDIAVVSLKSVYSMKNMNVNSLRSSQKYNILTNIGTITEPTNDNNSIYEHLSKEWIDKCIIYIVTLNMKYSTVESRNLWKEVLRSRYVVSIVRNYTIPIHSFVIEILSKIKGQNKRIAEVKEYQSVATNEKSIETRMSMRFFLKQSLRSIKLVLQDEPGLLGPKFVTVMSLLKLTQDELKWYELHCFFQLNKKQSHVISTYFKEKYLSEILYYILEIRQIIKENVHVIVKYYTQKMLSFNLPFIHENMKKCIITSDYESQMLHFISQGIVTVTNNFDYEGVQHVNNSSSAIFQGICLDILRLFSYIFSSFSEKNLNVISQDPLVNYLNNIYYDCHLLSDTDGYIDEFTIYDFFAFFKNNLRLHFKDALQIPNQHCYIVSFVLICSHFPFAAKITINDEMTKISNESIELAKSFINLICEELSNIVTQMCDEHNELSRKLLPKNCSEIIALNAQKKRNKKERTIRGKKKLKDLMYNMDYPGSESIRRDVENLAVIDKLHIALSQLCESLNNPLANQIIIHDTVLNTKEIFSLVLEKRLTMAIQTMVIVNSERNEITRPSELLHSLTAGMRVFQCLEDYVQFDACQIFNNVMPEQSLPDFEDVSENKSIASHYVTWYTNFFIRKVAEGNIVYSPTHMSFVSMLTETTLPFAAEEYGDITEMMALTRLIGPIGMKFLCEKVIWHVLAQYNEIKKLIIKNKEVLSGIRVCYDKPKNLKDLEKQLNDHEDFLERVSIIGVLLSFYDLAQSGLRMVLESKLPFFTQLLKNFNNRVNESVETCLPGNLSVYSTFVNSSGFKTKFDPILLSSIKNIQIRSKTDEYSNSCLFMVFFAISIPKLAKMPSTLFKNSIEGSKNNVHTLCKISTYLFPILFLVYGDNDDVIPRMKEFLALLSSSMLRTHSDVNEKETKNILRDSVYLLIESIISENPFLSDDLLDYCLPKILIKKAYHNIITNS
ncbi:hypothetical protein A3Q56_02925 [Intoshia linei]|uniref:Uncharacterized protein n=1 Tax=Intoshia linei TaxID=1819745 RepID=A0A177B500_9BILA|nr:hypothetical protein A3Q56_02925 [Intoshia linei]